VTGVAGWQRTAGVVGLVLFALARYAAWAANLEYVVGRTVLLPGRRGWGEEERSRGRRGGGWETSPRTPPPRPCCATGSWPVIPPEHRPP
jgi:hypothetical protein